MKPQKVFDRLALMGEELHTILKNDSYSIDIRSRAGRLHIDLLEDYHYCIDKDVTLNTLRSVMIEYEIQVMDLYKSI